MINKMKNNNNNNKIKLNKSLIFSLMFLFMLGIVSATTSLSLYSASNIQDDRAQLNGAVYSDDWERVYAGFEIRESGASSWQTLTSSFAWRDTASAPLYNVEFDYVVTGLDPSTSYDYRPVITQVEDSLGNGYSEYIKPSLYETFTTDEGYSAIEPILDTDSATSITSTEATLNGEILDMGGASNVDVSFAYRESGGNWIYTDETNEYVQTLSSAGTFSYTLTGLLPSTSYEFEAYGETVSGYESGGKRSFTTQEEPGVTPPSINVNSATEIGEDSARLNAELTSMGDYSSVDLKFFFKESSITGPIAPIQESEITRSSTGSFSFVKTGLTENTQYSFDIGYYDTEIGSYIYTSSPLTFTTLEKTYDWVNTTKTTLTTNNTAFNEVVSGLETGTEYTYRACVDVNNSQYCDTETTFTTLSLTPPTIDTFEVNTISDTTALLEGELTSMGDFSSVNVGFTLDEINAYSTTLSSTGTFSFLVTGLNPTTTYEFYSYAYSPGEYFVEDLPAKTFTTLSEIFLTPNEIKPFPNVIMSYNDNLSISVDEYYEFYDEVILNINDNEFVLGSNKVLTDNTGNDILNIEISSFLNTYFIDYYSFEQNKNYNVDYVIKNSNGNLTGTFDIEIYENATTGIDEPEVKENIFTKSTDFIIGLFPDSEDMTNVQKLGFVALFLIVVTILIVSITLATTKNLSIGVIYLALIIDSLLLVMFIVKGYVPIGFVIVMGLVSAVFGFFKIRGGMQ